MSLSVAVCMCIFCNKQEQSLETRCLLHVLVFLKSLIHSNLFHITAVDCQLPTSKKCRSKNKNLLKNTLLDTFSHIIGYFIGLLVGHLIGHMIGHLIGYLPGHIIGHFRKFIGTLPDISFFSRNF